MTAPALHVRWPTAAFYFAVLDASALPPGPRPTDIQLGYLFEAVLPEPLEAVHAIYRRLGDRRYLACGLARERLEAARAELGDAVTLTPAALPSDLLSVEDGAPPPAADLNLLVGAFAPESVRALRRRTGRAAGIAAAVVALAIFAGLERRIAAAHTRADAAEAQLAQRVEAVLPPTSLQNPLPPLLRLTAALRTLERTRGAPPVRDSFECDAVSSFSALLQHWPAAVPVRTESVLVSEGAMHVQAQVAANDAADRLAGALGQLPGWTMDFPRVDALGGAVRVALAWKRAAGGAP